MAHYVTIPIPAATLQDLVQRIFEAAGCAPGEAHRVAEHLVGANLAGHDSHGVARVPRYVEWLEKGFVLAGQHADQRVRCRGGTPRAMIARGRVRDRQPRPRAASRASRTSCCAAWRELRSITDAAEPARGAGASAHSADPPRAN
jgi:hypothetical protein